MSTNRSNDDLDALAARLRALPEPPVPAGLEARLLAAIPDPAALAPHRRWGRLALGGALAAAAAVLLVVLLGRLPGKPDAPPDGPQPPAPPGIAERPPTLGHHRLDESVAPMSSAFEWPVQLPAPRAARRLSDEPTD